MKRVLCDSLILVGWAGLICAPFTFGGSLALSALSFLSAHLLEVKSATTRPV